MTIAVPADAGLAWDAEEEFAKLAAATGLDLNDVAEGNGDEQLCASDDFVLLRGERRLHSNNRRANDWLMLNHRVPLGFPKSILSSVPLSSADTIWLADKLALPKEWVFTWDMDWGYSDSSPTEHSWEPMRRWHAMEKQLREPRGAKSVEHLEALRQSDPAPGTLFPRKLRATATEVSYDPIDRWTSLSRYLREPRGTKTLEHIKALRESPATAERQWTARGPAAGWLKAELLDMQQELPSLVRLPVDASAPRHEQTASPDNGEEEEEASTQSGDSWQALKPSGPRLPRILSNQLLDTLHDEDDFGWVEEPHYSLASRSGRLPISSASRSTSFDSDDLEDESLRSAALTGYERPTRSSERCSNDTIGSFLDDASDSGSLPATPRSPIRGGERGPVWAPPKGTFKDAEMAARVAAKAKSFDAEEIRSGVAANYRSTGFKVAPAKGVKDAKDPKFAKDAKDAVGKDLRGRAAPRAQLF